MRLFVWRALFWIWFTIRGYYILAKVWRALFERKYKGPLTTFTTLASLEQVLSEIQWTQDRWGGFLDTISKPERVEHAWRQRKETGTALKAVDCDDFAIYAAHAVKGLPNIATVYLLSVVRFDRNDGRFRGHNVCAFYDSFTKQWSHISNWDRGTARHGFEKLSHVVENVADGGQLIGWAAATPDLKLVDFSWNLPSV